MFALLIYVTGKPLLYGFKRRDFFWNDTHKVFVYGGEQTPATFNEAFEKCLKNNADMQPRVKVVEITGKDAPAVVAVVAPTRTAPVAALPTTVPRAITLEEAEAVVARLAPERLKKKTGPKHAMRVLEVA